MSDIADIEINVDAHLWKLAVSLVCETTETNLFVSDSVETSFSCFGTEFHGTLSVFPEVSSLPFNLPQGVSYTLQAFSDVSHTIYDLPKEPLRNFPRHVSL